MNEHVNRRAVIAGSATSVAGLALAFGSSVSHAAPAGNASVAAVATVDPKLRKLEAAFNAEYKKYLAVEPAHTAAERGCFRAKPPRPEEIKIPDELYERFRNLRLIEMTKDNPVYAAIDQYHETNRMRIEQWEAECAAVASRPEFIEPTEVFRRQLTSCDLAADRVLRFPARSLADIQVKTRIHRKWFFEEEEVLDVIIADIARVAKCQRQTRGDVSRATGGVTT